jgi:hypothetical protein
MRVHNCHEYFEMDARHRSRHWRTFCRPILSGSANKRVRGPFRSPPQHAGGWALTAVHLSTANGRRDRKALRCVAHRAHPGAGSRGGRHRLCRRGGEVAVGLSSLPSPAAPQGGREGRQDVLARLGSGSCLARGAGESAGGRPPRRNSALGTQRRHQRTGAARALGRPALFQFVCSQMPGNLHS